MEAPRRDSEDTEPVLAVIRRADSGAGRIG